MRGFRAWHKKLNRYLEPHEFYITPIGEVATACFTTLDGEVITVNSIEDFSCDDFEEGLVIIEEDTGLKDKNGKEIYEGDIVREVLDTGLEEIDGEYEYIVQWDDDFKEFAIQTTPKNKTFFHDELYQLNMSREVIGNIHENPELLEEKE